MIVNGQVEFSGSDSERAFREIQKPRKAPAQRRNAYSGDTMRLKVEKLPPATRAADIFLAITEQSSKKRDACENSGRQLRHTGVVRSLTSLGHLDMKKAAAYSAEASSVSGPNGSVRIARPTSGLAVLRRGSAAPRSGTNRTRPQFSRFIRAGY